MKALFKGLFIGLGIGLVLMAGVILYLYINEKPGEAKSVPNPPVVETEEPQASPSAPEEPAEEKSEEAMEPEAPAVQTEATLAFAGDVMFSGHYLTAYDKSGISAIADREMLSYMQGADLFLLNEEFPFSLRGEPWPDKQFTFRTDPKYVKILEELGADIVSVANNHSLDFGREAFCDTLDTLSQTEIACAGGGYNITEASAPVIRTVGEQTFAIFAATRVSPSYDWYATDSQAGIFQTYDPARLNAAIAEAKKTYDHIIVFVHWGIERNETPEEYQRTLARGYIDAGADLIVGCHPHVLQGFEYYQGVPIVYSLGNYLFDSRTGETLLLNAVFSKGEPPKIQLIPCQRSGDGVLKKVQEPSALYRRLTELSFDVEVLEDGTLNP